MKYCALFFITLFFASNVLALGRFFMTPEQRAKLEQQTSLTPTLATEAEVEQKLHINGFINPKHGASTIWVNGKTRSTTVQKDYFIRHWVSPSNQVSIDLQGKRAQLRPGQTLDIENQLITETPYPTYIKKDLPKSQQNNTEKSTHKKTASDADAATATNIDIKNIKDMLINIQQSQQQ